MNNIVKETLDARYTIPAAPLDKVWLNGALREVLDRLDAMIPRFTETFPAAEGSADVY